MDTVDDKVIRWRCRRGMKELDVILERFLHHGYEYLTTADKAAFSQLLGALDPDLFHWLTGKGLPEEPVLQNIVRLVRAKVESKAPP
ncbi:MAG: succinate dehydrogenase assembly factor 2 [Gammaproteobacteria bacterium]